MGRIRVWGPVVVAVVVVGIVVTVTWWRPWVSAADDSTGFTHYPGAVRSAATEPNWQRPGSGLFGLVPAGNCVLGFGAAENTGGSSPVFWTDPSGDCTRLAFDQANANGGDQAGSHYIDNTPDAGTVLPDGTFLGVATATDNNDGYSSAGIVLTHKGNDGQTLSTLDAPENANVEFAQRAGHVAFEAVTAMANGTVLIAGGQSNPATHNAGEPRVWRSTDGGRTLTPVTLPLTDQYSGYLTAIGASGATLVAAGAGVRLGGDKVSRLLEWTSVDGGVTWARASGTLPALGFAKAVLSTHAGWLVVGAADQYTAPVILRSDNGVHWAAVDLPGATAGGGVAGVAVDRTTGSLYAAGWTGKVLGTAVHGPDTCAALWTGAPDGRRWQYTKLGCDIAVPVGVATLPDGTVVLASNTDLWIHRPTTK